MTDPIFGAMRASTSGMSAQSTRLKLSAENLSNADTPGYRRKLASFAEAADGVEIGRTRLDPRAGDLVHEPGHPLSDENGMVSMSNVDAMIELADAREAGRGFDANLQVFGQARKLYDGLIGILRR